ncbi:MAG TPA: tetratricopeptide repeat protein, partial [Opitutaceae bacterium]|nr:tetratricopeptide repeat protein [Opitutaceae bacterium]
FSQLENLGQISFRELQTPLQTEGSTSIDEALQTGALALSIGMSDSALTQARTVLRGQPANPAARALLGRALLSAGNTKRAVDYLLAATQQTPSIAELWFDLAGALRQDRQMPNAVQALETSLRLDSKRLDAWLMLTELAKNVGADELARDALNIAKELDPYDPRVTELLSAVA